MIAASCASLWSRNVEIRSIPAGTEVQTLSGTKLGVTPLLLSGETLKRVSTGGRVEVMLTQAGYADRQLVLDIHGEDHHEVRMTALDGDYFAKHALSEFSKPINSLVRQLLQIQGMVMAKKLDQAMKSLEEFQSKYPNVASSFVLMANVELMRGKRRAARGYLIRAKSLDPSDAVISRMLAGTKD